MKRFQFFLAAVSILVLLGAFVSCSKGDGKTLKSLKSTESADGSTEVSKKRIAELEKGIKEYKEEADRTVKAGVEIGIYYRLVGLEYMKLKMYGKAYDNFQKAIEYYPENEVLFYYSGVSLARSAKSVLEDDERRRLMQKAVVYYQRAIELNGRYEDVYYALSVLYMFELNRPLDALKAIKKLLNFDPGNIDALFIKARADAVTGNIRDAVDTYNKIIKISKDEKATLKAREFRDALMSGGSNG
ncbi:MAG: hypothetical protein DRP59_07925 [Spirochaetes bacterium]|nr:MAG: hypothetical protein DRP59_07925 [Spirochaetota bacterium]